MALYFFGWQNQLNGDANGCVVSPGEIHLLNSAVRRRDDGASRLLVSLWIIYERRCAYRSVECGYLLALASALDTYFPLTYLGLILWREMVGALCDEKLELRGHRADAGASFSRISARV